MQAISYRGRVLNYRRVGKLLVGILIVMYIINPVLILRHGKGVGRFIGKRCQAIRYEYIKETKGDLFYNMTLAKDEWLGFGKAVGKIGKDFVGMWK